MSALLSLSRYRRTTLYIPRPLAVGILALRSIVSLFLCHILHPQSLSLELALVLTTCDEPDIYVLVPWYFDVKYCLSSLQLYYPSLPYAGEQGGIEIRFIQSEKSPYSG